MCSTILLGTRGYSRRSCYPSPPTEVLLQAHPEDVKEFLQGGGDAASRTKFPTAHWAFPAGYPRGALNLPLLREFSAPGVIHRPQLAAQPGSSLALYLQSAAKDSFSVLEAASTPLQKSPLHAHVLCSHPRSKRMVTEDRQPEFKSWAEPVSLSAKRG